VPDWHKISQRKVLSHPRLSVVEDEVVLPDGSTTHYLRFANEKDYVTVIAKDDELIALVTDYSYPNSSMLLQFPEGTIDNGESPEMAAKRELKEETGLLAESFKQIGHNLGHHRRSTNMDFIMFTEKILERGSQQLEVEEAGTGLLWFNSGEIRHKIASGEIIQKNTLAAWAIYEAINTDSTES
jgi:8-oxo-dGTP pyrophosphatase MutT (NUDIX family)